MNDLPYRQCSPSKLMDDAALSMATYLAKSKRLINEELGDDFAEKNPDLLGRALITCAVEFQTGYFGQKFEELANVIAFAVDPAKRS